MENELWEFKHHHIFSVSQKVYTNLVYLRDRVNNF